MRTNVGNWMSLRGWLPSTRDHIGDDANFDWLRDLGVSFYNDSVLGPLKMTGIAPSIGVAPIFSTA
jgi:hypothetical protein